MKIQINYNHLIQFLLLFFIEFDVPHAGFLSARKIAVALLLYHFMKQHEVIKISKQAIRTMAWIGLFFVYVVGLLTIQVDSFSQLPEGHVKLIFPIGIFLLLFFFPLLLCGVFHNVEEFVRCQWMVILFQAALVLLGRIFLPIRMFVFEQTAFGDGRLYEGVKMGIRSVGIDLAGASGSMVLFVGIMCGVYLFYQTKIEKEKRDIIFGWGLIMTALLFVGRTGLYFGGLVLICVFFQGLRRRDKSVKWIMFGMATLVIGGLFYDMVIPNSRWIHWITEFSRLFEDKNTLAALGAMNIPPFSMEMFWGTGLFRGETASGLVLNHDAGYVQTYAGVGVVGAVLYYGLIYYFYHTLIYRVPSMKNKWIYRALLLVLAIAEMKEPFLRKTPLLLILSCMLMLETGFCQSGSFRNKLLTNGDFSPDNKKVII